MIIFCFVSSSGYIHSCWVVIYLMQLLIFMYSEHESVETAEAPAKRPRLDPFADLRCGASSSPGPVAISVQEELSTYKVLRPSTIAAPLQFWKDQAKQ